MSPHPHVRKIAVVGCGAVGSFYGARLCQAGQRVHFLLRSDFEQIARTGVQIQSVEGDFQARPIAARNPAEIGVSDLVIVGLKTTANDQFDRLLPPLAGPETLILSLQNGLGNEERLAHLFGPANILGGHCFVCLNRVRPGFIRHIAHGRIVIGEYQRPSQARTQAVATLFRDAGVPCDVTEDLGRAHWEKLVWNIPFNGLGVAGTAGYDAVAAGRAPPTRLEPCLPTDVLLADPRWLGLVGELMREVVAAANALGYGIPEAFVAENLDRTRNMGAYRASTLLDFERGLPLELESLFLEPQRQARLAGVATPRLDALCAVLRKLDARPQGIQRQNSSGFA